MAGIIRSSRRSGKIDLDEYQRQIRECDIEINKNENLSTHIITALMQKAH